jgi:hypothetical protein
MHSGLETGTNYEPIWIDMFQKTLLVVLLALTPVLTFSQLVQEEDAQWQSELLRASVRYGEPGAVTAEQGFANPLFQNESEPFYPSRKSPVLAGLMSLVVPGAGDVYAENYIMSVVFIAAEAVGWYFNIQQNAKGDDQTTVYQNFADGHWSVVRYAEWLNAHATKFEGGENTPQIPINPDESLPLWERVDWDVMNEVEISIPVFSHRLPAHGEQQYFELIGKYHQYTYGWDDKVTISDGYSDYRTISPRFSYYSDQRGMANDYYETASLVINLVVLNHVLAAINAAWSAARFNKSIELYSHMEFMRVGNAYVEAVPTATFKVRL